MTLTSHEVHVWYRLSEGLDGAAVDAALTVLSPGERARHDRLRFSADRRDYAAAHALLRTSLSRYVNIAPQAWVFESDSRGKPKLSDRCADGFQFTFSLSHTRGLVACAIASCAAVGIDAERIDPAVDWSPVVTRCFSPKEIAQLECDPSVDRAGRFAELWTLKEAHAKATGSGLSDSWPAYEFDVTGGSIKFSPPPAVDSGSWQFAVFTPAQHYRLAVAVERPRNEVRTIAARCQDESQTSPRLLSMSGQPDWSSCPAFD